MLHSVNVVTTAINGYFVAVDMIRNPTPGNFTIGAVFVGTVALNRVPVFGGFLSVGAGVAEII